MAQEGYFAQFPLITYANATCVDISRRVKVLENVMLNYEAFYPYQIKESQRIDTIADKYYDSPFYSWLLYLSNQIIDPYYDYMLTDEQLQNHLISEFGSFIDTQQRVVYWQNNYYNDNSIITQSGYDSLPDYAKRYYSPIYQPTARVQTYERTQEDWTMNCNQIKSLQFSKTPNTDFQENDLMMFYLAGTPIGSAQVLRVQNNIVNYNQVQGYTDNYLLFSTVGSNNFILNETVQLYATTNNFVTDGVLISLGVNNTAMVQVNAVINAMSIDNMVGLTSNCTINITDILTKSSYVVGYNNQANLYYDTTTTILVNIPNDEAVYWSPVTVYDLANQKNIFNSTIRILDKAWAPLALQDLKTQLNK